MTEPSAPAHDRASAAVSSTSVSDTVDDHGLSGAVIDGLQAITAHGSPAIGRARTATLVASDEPGIPGIADLFDTVSEGDVLVLGWSVENDDRPISTLGGLAGRRVSGLGARAVVTDGWVRDVAELIETTLTVWASGATPRSGKGRIAVTGVGEPTEIGDVTVHAGDLVVADATGVCVVAAADADAALTGAEDLESRDAAFEQRLIDGSSFGDAAQETGTM
jgi:4-hydroxy-4-methyl-2-oxoglutarate aldolase